MSKPRTRHPARTKPNRIQRHSYAVLESNFQKFQSSKMPYLGIPLPPQSSIGGVGTMKPAMSQNKRRARRKMARMSRRTNR